MTARSKQAAEWLKRAESDLQYAQVGERETRQHHITCFLCQQVVEKILKGLIVLSGETPERSHNLGRLCSMAMQGYPWLKKLLPKIRRLDKYYTTARYPDDLTFEFSPEDAKEGLAIASEMALIARQEMQDVG